MKFFQTLLPIALLTSITAGVGLHNAVFFGCEKRCKELLDNGANVNKRAEYGWTPLVESIYYNRKKCFDRILKHEKVHVNLTYAFGRTALHFAAEYGNEDMCRALLEKGADINARDDDGSTPLVSAIAHGHNKCAKMILDETIDVSFDNFNQTALHFAAEKGNGNFCGALLEKGADVNAQVGNGRTPLMLAIDSDNNDCVKMILRKYPNLEIENKHHETALHIAKRYRNAEMIEILQIGNEKGVEEAVRFFLKEKQSLMNIRYYVAGKRERKAKVLTTIKM